MDTITTILTPEARQQRTLGKQLAAWRVLSGLSQSALARKLRSHQTEVSRIECDKLQPGPRLAKKIAKLTGIEFPS